MCECPALTDPLLTRDDDGAQEVPTPFEPRIDETAIDLERPHLEQWQVGIEIGRLLGAVVNVMVCSDPLTLSAVAITLLVVATLAVAMPALRAMRIDPWRL